MLPHLKLALDFCPLIAQYPFLKQMNVMKNLCSIVFLTMYIQYEIITYSTNMVIPFLALNLLYYPELINFLKFWKLCSGLPKII